MEISGKKMNIAAFRRLTLSDYPGKPAAIVFTQGCNFRCPYCHNPELMEPQGEESIAEAEVVEFLENRRGRLQGVVISGGEPCLWDGLGAFLERLKRQEYLVKLDTNGSRPGVLEGLIKRKLVDYVAMDVKGPLWKYETITGCRVDVENICKSIRSIMAASGIDYEFRTTVVKSQLSPGDLETIGETINGARRYVLQRYVPSNPLDPLFVKEGTYTDREFAEVVTRISLLVKECRVR